MRMSEETAGADAQEGERAGALGCPLRRAALPHQKMKKKDKR
jgi:hypothetical protein